jgi:large subunit ribosomal protein L18
VLLKKIMDKKVKRNIRKKRIRAKVVGTRLSPRLSVFRSNKHIYAQLIDDGAGKTLVSASDRDMANKKNKTQRAQKKTEKSENKNSKIEKAGLVGESLAKKAKAKKIKKVVFDRGGYKYHGRVKALAEGAREGGLKF